jgi:hypothetical protein
MQPLMKGFQAAAIDEYYFFNSSKHATLAIQGVIRSILVLIVDSGLQWLLAQSCFHESLVKG